MKIKLNLTSKGKIDDEFKFLFDQILSHNIANYNKIIDDINHQNIKNNDWHFSLPSSRNTLISDNYLYYCYLILIKDILNLDKKIDFILVDSDVLDILLKENFNIKIINSNKKKGLIYKIKEQINLYIYILYQILFRYYQFFIIKIFFNNKTKNLKNISLIETFIIPNFILEDRYFGNLKNYILNNKHFNFYYLPTFVYIKSVKLFNVLKILGKNDKIKYVFKDNFLNYTDIIKSILSCLRVRKIKIIAICKIYNFNISKLILSDLHSLRSVNISIESHINFYFIKRMKEKNVKINIFLDWWENQSMDKAMSLAINTYYPNTNHIGYLGYAPRKMELQLSPTKLENEIKLIPKKIVVIGSYFINKIKFFDSSLNVITGPAFRYSYLWNIIKKKPANNKTIDLLIALPILYDDSQNIIDLFFDYFHSKITNINLIKNIYIKPHPVNSQSISTYIKSKKDNRSILVYDKIEIYLKKIDLFIGSNSISCLEAAFLDIPVINIINESKLNFSPFPEYIKFNMVFNVTNSKALIEIIDQIINRKIISNFNNNIRKNYLFTPVNDKNINKILNFKNE